LNDQIKYKLDMDKIIKKTTLDQNSLKLSQIKTINVLPFITSSAKTDANEIPSIEAEVFRSVLGIDKANMSSNEKIIDEILSKVKTTKSQLLADMLNAMYIDNGAFKNFHPIMHTYGGKESSGIKNISNYIIDVLMTEDLVEFLERVMQCKPNSVIEELILEAIPYVKDNRKKIAVNDYTMLPKVQEVFLKDFVFLCTDKTLFVNNIDKLMSYYLFFYISQIILSLKSGFTEEDSISDVYYFLDWEKASRARVSYGCGWKMIEKKSKNIFAYVNLLQILNCVKESDQIGSFNDLYTVFNGMDLDDQVFLEKDITELNAKIMEVLKIKELNKIDKKIFGEYTYLDTLLQLLICAKDTGREQAFKRYENRIKDIADLGFLKPRGQLGSTLNLKQEWVIFLTRLCIGKNGKNGKNGKIRLNELWEELTKRGVNFDKYSKEKIIEYFEKINILEKKSDSGDAQYVRVL